MGGEPACMHIQTDWLGVVPTFVACACVQTIYGGGGGGGVAGEIETDISIHSNTNSKTHMQPYSAIHTFIRTPTYTNTQKWHHCRNISSSFCFTIILHTIVQ